MRKNAKLKRGDTPLTLSAPDFTGASRQISGAFSPKGTHRWAQNASHLLTFCAFLLIPYGERMVAK
nr:MAG TPA: hypothetical protein [Caudoviricetes sp.]